MVGGQENGHKLKKERFRLDIQKIFSTTRTFKDTGAQAAPKG